VGAVAVYPMVARVAAVQRSARPGKRLEEP